jgi:hypothetical protein
VEDPPADEYETEFRGMDLFRDLKASFDAYPGVDYIKLRHGAVDEGDDSHDDEVVP